MSTRTHLVTGEIPVARGVAAARRRQRPLRH